MSYRDDKIALLEGLLKNYKENLSLLDKQDTDKIHADVIRIYKKQIGNLEKEIEETKQKIHY
jgi:hypothetical protein